MSYLGLLVMSIQDVNGKYLTATQNFDTLWTVTPVPGQTFIKVLPEGWADTTIEWERDMSYLGIFRSKGGADYKFSQDARAIIQNIRNTQGIQGYGLFTIWIWNEATFGYDVFYQANLDFKNYNDNHQLELLSIGIIDNGLIRQVHAYGDTQYNIPYWTTSDGGVNWDPQAEFLMHPGIKLLYNSTYVGPSDPIIFSDDVFGGGLQGFNNGNHASGGLSGFHFIPNMSSYNIVQNNGTTTYIGNDIMQPFLIQGSQTGGANGNNEEDFAGTNNSQPYTRNNFSLKNAIPNAVSGITMHASVSGTFNGTVDVQTNGTNQFIGFGLFEVGPLDFVTPKPGFPQLFNFIHILDFQLPDVSTTITPYTPTPPTDPTQPTFSNYKGGTVPLRDGTRISLNPTEITLNPNKAYIFGIIWDNDAHVNNGNWCGFDLTNLQFSIYSKYNSGTDAPEPAPSLNPSSSMFFRGHSLLSLLIQNLATTNSDLYGFPKLVPTPYSGHSDILSNAFADPIGDFVPYQVAFTSAYALHNLQGQSYLTISLNQFFDFWKKQGGFGATIEGNVFRIEPLNYFFNNAVMILDLGYDVVDFEDSQLTEGIGSNLKLGYAKADTNTDFGVDPFITELFFNTPLSNIPAVMDYEETGILCEQYAIEKIRAQKTSQPIGASYDPGNPSSDNQTVALYVNFSHDPDTADFPNPINENGLFNYYQVEQFSTAQSTDPTAATFPYIYGMYYPDTAINMRLSPCRALRRGTGQLLHSVLDQMDADFLTFRNTGVMQYNNQVVGLSGIESNLVSGGDVVTEFKDIAIGNLPSQLFKPIIFKVKSRYPVNLYQILTTNPNGYIRFFWKNKAGITKEYKMFLTKATQAAGTNAATEFEGWATPDMIL